MNTIYTLKPSGLNFSHMASVLPSDGTRPVQLPLYGTIAQLQEAVKERYGEDAQRVSPRKFDEEVASRQVHTPDVCAMLTLYGERIGEDLSSHVVYGSPMRPMNSVWARIADAVYMPVDKQKTGHHTYIAVPGNLDAEVVEKYELVFVSRPQ